MVSNRYTYYCTLRPEKKYRSPWYIHDIFVKFLKFDYTRNIFLAKYPEMTSFFPLFFPFYVFFTLINIC